MNEQRNKPALPLPEPGQEWISRDKRDDGLLVTVLEVTQNYVIIKRFRESRVRRDRWHREYRPAFALGDSDE